MADRPITVITHRVFPETIAILQEWTDLRLNEEEMSWPGSEVRRMCREASAMMAFMPDTVDEDFLKNCGAIFHKLDEKNLIAKVGLALADERIFQILLHRLFVVRPEVGLGVAEEAVQVDAADVVLADLTDNDNLGIVKDYNGNPYLPEWDFNGIGTLERGFGYQIKISEAINEFNLCNP